MTDEELASYYSQHGAAQGIDKMRRGLPRLVRRIEATSTASQGLALGTDAQMQADLHALEALPDPTPHQRATAHQIRDLLAVKGLMGDRSYKG